MAQISRFECGSLRTGTPSAGTKHFDAYTRMHIWAIEMAAHALALLNFGTEYLSRMENHLIYLTFAPISTSTASSSPRLSTPENAYELADISAKAYADFRGTREWKENDPAFDLPKQRAMMVEHVARSLAAYGLPAAHGVLHVGLTVSDGSADTSFRFFPNWRARPGHPPLDAPPVRAILADLVLLCSNSMRTALPFQPVDLNVACPGRFERTEPGAQRVWKPLFTSWDAYAAGETEVGPLDALEGLTTGAPPHILMMMLHAFRPHEGGPSGKGNSK